MSHSQKPWTGAAAFISHLSFKVKDVFKLRGDEYVSVIEDFDKVVLKNKLINLFNSEDYMSPKDVFIHEKADGFIVDKGNITVNVKDNLDIKLILKKCKYNLKIEDLKELLTDQLEIYILGWNMEDLIIEGVKGEEGFVYAKVESIGEVEFK